MFVTETLKIEFLPAAGILKKMTYGKWMVVLRDISVAAARAADWCTNTCVLTFHW